MWIEGDCKGIYLEFRLNYNAYCHKLCHVSEPLPKDRKGYTYIFLTHHLLLSLPWSLTQSAKSFLFACVNQKTLAHQSRVIVSLTYALIRIYTISLIGGMEGLTLISTNPSLSSNP